MPVSSLPLQVDDEGVVKGYALEMDFVGAGVSVAMSGASLTKATVTIAGASGSFAPVNFTQDLGAARSSGTFDITGLSGLTAEKNVMIWQTAQKISSKGDARDEAEFDQIQITGYVVDATTIRCYWNATGVVVGTYAFAYIVSG